MTPQPIEEPGKKRHLEQLIAFSRTEVYDGEDCHVSIKRLLKRRMWGEGREVSLKVGKLKVKYVVCSTSKACLKRMIRDFNGVQETMTEISPCLSGSNVKKCEEECTRNITRGSSRLRIQDKCIKKK